MVVAVLLDHTFANILLVSFMNRLYITMESILYNRVGLKEFLNRGAFTGYPGIRVSASGKMYLIQEGKTAPLMIDVPEGDVIIKNSYPKSQGDGIRLLVIFPELFNSSAGQLYNKWLKGSQADTDGYKQLVPTGTTYLNYKHDVADVVFPAQASAFGFIPCFYRLPQAKISGISYRVCPTHELQLTSVPRSELEYKPDADDIPEFVVASDEPPAPKKQRTSLLTMLPKKK